MLNTIDLFSVAGGIIAFTVYVIVLYFNGCKPKLEEAVFVSIAGGMLPVSVALIIHPFFPSVLDSIPGFQITLIGLVLLFVYSKVIINKIWPDTS